MQLVTSVKLFSNHNISNYYFKLCSNHTISNYYFKLGSNHTVLHYYYDHSNTARHLASKWHFLLDMTTLPLPTI